MGKQREDQRHEVARSAQAVKDGPVCCGKGLATLRADEAPVLARMDANIPLAGLASGGTRHIGADMSLWGPCLSSKERWGTYLRGVWLDPRLYHKATSPRLAVASERASQVISQISYCTAERTYLAFRMFIIVIYPPY